MSHADLFRGNQSVVMQAPIQADLRDQALENLKLMYEQGLLKPVAGVHPAEGSVLDIYIDILGLNDRVLRDSERLR